MSVARGVAPLIDVLVVTAVKEEWDAVLEVDTGAEPGSAWQTQAESTGPDVSYRNFVTQTGVLRVAVIQSFGMGREQAVIAAAPLLERHPEVRCLAMCGVCAGRRGDVSLGDVIVADRTWPYDAGKVKVTVDDKGQRTERFQGDMDLYRIHPPEWKQRAERFQPDPDSAWIKQRPRSHEEQGDWVMESLARSENPRIHPDRPTKCPNWPEVLDQLWKVHRLEDGELKLTGAGGDHIRRRMTREPDGLLDPKPFKVVMGPIASGAPVVHDPAIFERLSDMAMRKVIGVEMETSAILALAYLRKVPHAVVMKGVMDHADVFKSDNMKPFAAMAAAECLFAFLRQNLTPPDERRPATPEQLMAASAAGIPGQLRSVGRNKYDRVLFVPRGNASGLHAFIAVECKFHVEATHRLVDLETISHGFRLAEAALPAIRETRAAFARSLAPGEHERAMEVLRAAFYFREVTAIERSLSVAVREKSPALVRKGLFHVRDMLRRLPFMDEGRIQDFLNCGYDLARNFAAAGVAEGTGLHREALAMLPSLPRAETHLPVVLATEILVDLGRLVVGLQARCSMVVARAGRGKTNVLCNLAEQLVAEGSPVVLLSGQMTLASEDDIELRVRTQLGSIAGSIGDRWMDSVTAGLAPTRGWLYVIIDGINENSNPNLMTRALEVFLTHCEGQRVKVIASCRDILWELFSRQLTPFLHDRSEIRLHDFDDAEWEAALRIYCASYDITLPDRPQALRAMRNPILLRFFCETNRGQRLQELAEFDLAAVFDGYLHEVVRRIGDRLMLLGPNMVLDTLLRAGHAMWTKQSGTLELADLGFTLEDAAPANSLYNQLRSEGVIFEEVVPEPWQRGGIRIVYDEFMEYLIARAWSRGATVDGDPVRALDEHIRAAVRAFTVFAPAWGALMFLDRVERAGGSIVNRAIEAFSTLGDELMASRQAALLVAFQNMSIEHLDDRVLEVLARFEELASPEIKERLASILNDVLASRGTSPRILELARKILEVGPAAAIGASEEPPDPHLIQGLPPARHHYSPQIRLTAMTLLATSGASDVSSLLEEGVRRMGTLDLHTALESMQALDGASDDVVLAVVAKHIRARLPEYRVYCAWLLRSRYGAKPASAMLDLLTDEQTRVHRFTFRLFETRKVEVALLEGICARIELSSAIPSWHLVSLVRLLGDTQRFVTTGLTGDLRARVVTALERLQGHSRPAIRLEAYKALFRQGDFVDRQTLLAQLDDEDDVYLRRFATEQGLRRDTPEARHS
jgi:nucleoside phosphorylase